MTYGVLPFDDFMNALAPMNKGFLVWGLLTGLVSELSTGNVISRDLQSIDGLCFSNQERPRITGFDGVLMMLKMIRLLY